MSVEQAAERLREYSQEERSRFARYCAKDDSGCVVWLKGCDNHGYGKFFYRGRQIKAHHAACEMAGRYRPEGLVCDHLCRNRRCVNPDHIEFVTTGDNTRRGLTHALKTHCRHGHEFTGENVEFRKRGNKTVRLCRKCHRERNAMWYAGKKSSDPMYGRKKRLLSALHIDCEVVVPESEANE